MRPIRSWVLLYEFFASIYIALAFFTNIHMTAKILLFIIGLIIMIETIAKYHRL